MSPDPEPAWYTRYVERAEQALATSKSLAELGHQVLENMAQAERECRLGDYGRIRQAEQDDQNQQRPH